MSTQDHSIKDEYLSLLNLAYEVAQSLEGKKSSDSRWPDCQKLALKLFMHSATVFWLGKEGTKSTVPYSTQGASFFDFSSIAVLTRTILETYLNMFIVFFEPKTEDEFEYNHALWELSGFIIRENYIPSDPTLQNKIANSQQEIQEIRSRIQNTEIFKLLKPNIQKDVLKGRDRRGLKYKAKKANFGVETINQMASYLSGFVHSDGLSATQIMTPNNELDRHDFIENFMRLIILVLSKMIIEYANKFPESEKICNQYPDVYSEAEKWSEVASILP